jgi:hypothetical protein
LTLDTPFDASEAEARFREAWLTLRSQQPLIAVQFKLSKNEDDENTGEMRQSFHAVHFCERSAQTNTFLCLLKSVYKAPQTDVEARRWMQDTFIVEELDGDINDVVEFFDNLDMQKRTKAGEALCLFVPGGAKRHHVLINYSHSVIDIFSNSSVFKVLVESFAAGKKTDSSSWGAEVTNLPRSVVRTLEDLHHPTEEQYDAAIERSMAASATVQKVYLDFLSLLVCCLIPLLTFSLFSQALNTYPYTWGCWSLQWWNEKPDSHLHHRGDTRFPSKVQRAIA